MASPAQKPVDATAREVWSVERYKASALPAILTAAGSNKFTGSVTIHLSQGVPASLEIRTKVSN